MITFVVVGIVGLVLVLFSMILGEFIEFGDDLLSGTALGVGGIVFGAIGAIVVANELPAIVAYAGSAVAAVAVVALVQLLVRHLRDTEDGVAVPLVGTQGTATAPIDAAHGEVSLDAVQELERRLAWADEPIPEGARVVVVEQSGSRVRVQRRFPGD